MLFSRFLTPEAVRINGVYQPLSDEPLRRYLGQFLPTQQEGVNVHPTVADYWRNLIFDLAEPKPGQKQLLQSLDEASLYRALYGFGVVMREGDQLSAVNTRFWWPILVRGVQVGSIIVMPFREQPLADGLAAQVGPPDFAHVVIALDAFPTAYSAVHQWSGITLGALVSQTAISPVRIASFGDGVSEFVRAGLWPMDAIAERTAGVNRILRKHENPHLQAPSSALQYGPDGAPTLRLATGGSILPTTQQDREWKYLQLQGDSPLHNHHLRNLYAQISANTAIPLNVFGQEQARSRSETGTALEVEHNVSLAKIRRLQGELVAAAADLGYELEFPPPAPQEPSNGQQSESPSTDASGG